MPEPITAQDTLDAASGAFGWTGNEALEYVVYFLNQRGLDADFDTWLGETLYAQDDANLYQTLAPEAYDGFGTRTIGAAEFSGQVMRRVWINPQHYDWQTQRYASGGYLTIPDHCDDQPDRGK